MSEITAYVGQTRSRALMARLTSFGVGEMTVRGELPPRRLPWAMDNGAFRDWSAKPRRPFDGNRFLRDVEAIERMERGPDFLVVPDIVAGGVGSLGFSEGWVRRLFGVAPLYLAVQDGMVPGDIRPLLKRYDGIFVGGTLSWKISTGQDWVAVAHGNNKLCHIGRVGTRRRVAWAIRIGADSIDSCLPLWSQGNLDNFMYALRGVQKELF